MKTKIYKRKRIVFSVLFCLICSASVRFGYYYFFAAAQLPDLMNPGIFDEVQEVRMGHILYGRFKWRINKELNRCTEVMYVIPFDPKTGKPGQNASNVIFYAPYQGAQNTLLKEGAEPYTKKLAEKYGYTVVTMTIFNNRELRRNPQTSYMCKNSGWHDLALKAVHHVQEQFGLGNKKIFVLGDSSGGSMAQQMCVNYPDEIDAGIWCGGAEYQKIPEGLQMPMLGMYSWGDGVALPTRSIGIQGRAAGCPILTSETFPRGGYLNPDGYEHHYTPEQAMETDYAYISGCVKLRDENGGILPPVNEWPVQFEIDGTPVQLPSEECKKKWDRMPGQSLLKFTDRNESLFGLFPDKKPDKMMIFVLPRETNDDTKAKDYLYTAYLQGQAAAQFLLPTNDVRSGVVADSLLAKLNDAVKKTENPSLKICIIGQDTAIKPLYTIAQNIESNNKDIVISPVNATRFSRDKMLANLKSGVQIRYYSHEQSDDNIPDYVNVNVIPGFKCFQNELEWIKTL